MVSLRSRSATRVLPMFRASGYPDQWLAAGDDRSRLAALAKARRRFDAHSPPKLLARRWSSSAITVGRHTLHVLSPRSQLNAAPTVARSNGRPRLMLYLHGGGYVFGPTAIEWFTMSRLARLVGADLAVWDYPKVPESTADQTLPATLEAWGCLVDRYGPENIVLVGFSAGGGLALSLILQRRGLGQPQPAGAVLCSPWLDVTLSHPDIEPMVDGDVVLSVEGLRRDGELFAGSYGVEHPLISPRFSEFHELPPALFFAGEHEILLPDSRDVVDRINELGGAASLEVEPCGQHAGLLLPTPEGAKARNQIVAFAGRVLGP